MGRMQEQTYHTSYILWVWYSRNLRGQTGLCWGKWGFKQVFSTKLFGYDWWIWEIQASQIVQTYVRILFLAKDLKNFNPDSISISISLTTHTYTHHLVIYAPYTHIHIYTDFLPAETAKKPFRKYRSSSVIMFLPPWKCSKTSRTVDSWVMSPAHDGCFFVIRHKKILWKNHMVKRNLEFAYIQENHGLNHQVNIEWWQDQRKAQQSLHAFWLDMHQVISG